MIVYYKRLANTLMVLGALLGAMVGLIHYRGVILGNPSKIAIFVFALYIFTGIIVFRLIGAVVANKKLKEVQSLLFLETKPKEFLSVFEPVNARVPHNLAEYANGQHWISYAREALGDFDGAWDAIKDLKPEELKIHALTTSSLIVNQKTNLKILKRDYEAAEYQIEDLKQLKVMAEKRARRLSDNLSQQIRVQEARIAAAKGSEDADIKYLEEEIQYASNVIYKKEIQLEVAEYYLRKGDADSSSREKAMSLLQDIVDDRKGLYTEQAAEKLIEDPDSVYVFVDAAAPETDTDINADPETGADTQTDSSIDMA